MTQFEMELAELVDGYRGKVGKRTMFAALGDQAVRVIEDGWGFGADRQLNLPVVVDAPSMENPEGGASSPA